MSTTLKDRQRLAVIPNDPDTPMTVKDRQRHSATSNDYMETRLNDSKNLKIETVPGPTACPEKIYVSGLPFFSSMTAEQNSQIRNFLKIE